MDSKVPVNKKRMDSFQEATLRNIQKMIENPISDSLDG